MAQFSEETEPDYRHAEIDLFLDPRVRGRGLGPDAVRALADHMVCGTRPSPDRDRRRRRQHRCRARVREGRIPPGRRDGAVVARPRRTLARRAPDGARRDGRRLRADDRRSRSPRRAGRLAGGPRPQGRGGGVRRVPRRRRGVAGARPAGGRAPRADEDEGQADAGAARAAAGREGGARAGRGGAGRSRSAPRRAPHGGPEPARRLGAGRDGRRGRRGAPPRRRAARVRLRAPRPPRARLDRHGARRAALGLAVRVPRRRGGAPRARALPLRARPRRRPRVRPGAPPGPRARGGDVRHRLPPDRGGRTSTASSATSCT